MLSPQQLRKPIITGFDLSILAARISFYKTHRSNQVELSPSACLHSAFTSFSPARKIQVVHQLAGCISALTRVRTQLTLRPAAEISLQGKALPAPTLLSTLPLSTLFSSGIPPPSFLINAYSFINPNSHMISWTPL